MSYYFAIVGAKDTPLFEHEFGTSKAGGDGQARFRPEARHMNQFIVHASVDIVDEVQWSTGQMYLKHIDRFHNNFVSCFLTPSNTKFLLLFNPDAHISSSFPPGSAGISSTTATATSSSSSSPPPNTLKTTTATTATTKARPSILSRTTTSDATSTSTSNNEPTYSPPTTFSLSPMAKSSTIASSSTLSTLNAASTSASTPATSTSTAASASASATNFNPTAPVTEEAHRAFFADVFDAWVKTAMNPFYAVEDAGGNVDVGGPMPVRNPVFRNRVAAAGKKFL